MWLIKRGPDVPQSYIISVSLPLITILFSGLTNHKCIQRGTSNDKQFQTTVKLSNEDNELHPRSAVYSQIYSTDVSTGMTEI